MFENHLGGHGYCETQTKACWLEKQVGDSLCSAVCIGGGVGSGSKTEQESAAEEGLCKGCAS